MRLIHLAFVFILALSALTGLTMAAECTIDSTHTGWPNGTAFSGPTWAMYATYTIGSGPQTSTLLAGQTIDAGTITIFDDGSSLIVTYTTTDGWMLNQTHLSFASSASGIPHAGNGNPIPGQFPYQTVHSPIVSTYTYTEPLNGLSGTIIVAPHATLVHQTGDCGSFTPQSDPVAQVTVIKHVVNSYNGPLEAGDFTMHVDAANPSQSSFSGDEAGTAITFDAGAYSVSEDAVDGYIQTYNDCSGTLGIGQNVTCTIVNNDLPGMLVVTKHVVKNYHGLMSAADFSLTTTGPDSYSSTYSGGEAGTILSELKAGTYGTTEDAVDGYEQVSSDCDSVVVTNGHTSTCTIENHDLPGTLIVRKHVINDNGGTLGAGNFSLTTANAGVFYVSSLSGSDGNDYASSSDGSDYTSTYAGSEEGQNLSNLSAGIYSTTEDGVYGYAQTGSDCDFVIVTNGHTSECTITNDDIAPMLTVIKHVINHDVGNKSASDFTMLVSGTSVSEASFPGSETGTTVTLNAGDYGVTESGGAGYIQNLSPDCSGTIGIGEEKTCTLTNDFGPTRTQGFWSTHYSAASAVWAGIGNTTIGTRDVDNVNKAMGGFWSNIAKTTTGAKRSALDRARMQLLQQLEAAMLNKQAFGTSDGGLIAQAMADFAGSNTAAILADASALDAFNNGGDSIATPAGFVYGSAGKTGQNNADKAFWNSLP